MTEETDEKGKAAVLKETEYWHEGSRVWLAAVCSDSDGMPYEEAMLTGVQRDAFLPFQVRYQDDRKYYLYETTGRVPLASHLGKSMVDHAAMTRIIRSIIGVCDAAEEYLLDINAVVMDPAFIYMSLADPQLAFLYLPGYSGDFNAGIRELAAELLAGADHQDQDCVLLVYEFFRIVREEDFCPASLKALIEEEISPVIFSDPDGPAPAAPDPVLPLYGEPEEPEPEKNRHKKLPEMNMGHLIPAVVFAVFCGGVLAAYYYGWIERLCLASGWQGDVRIPAVGAVLLFGLILYLVPVVVRVFREKPKVPDMEPVWFDDGPEDEQTRFLQMETSAFFKRLDMPDIPDIRIRSFPAVIGSASGCDILIGVEGVSRRHAVVIQSGAAICIRDEHSTNGTFVNGRRLAPDEMAVLSPGDVVTLAGVKLAYMA